MNIAYVGNFKHPHCTEVHLAATLENLGHTVYRLQEDEVTQNELTGMLTHASKVWDLFLFTRTWGQLVTLEHLRQLREYKIPSASYHLDLYVGLSRKWLHEGRTLEDVLQTDPFWRTDYVFTPDGDPESAEVFKANGVNHRYMKPGVFEQECYIALHFLKEHDVLFVGGGDRIGSPNIYGHPEWNYRNELVTWLYDTYGARFSKFGHPQPTIRNAELNKLYGNSKIVVGDSVCVDFNHTYYWSDRVYETLGRGGFLIHPYIKGLDEEFTDKEHLVYYEYGNYEQLKELIDYYLEHDDEREAIRLAGHNKVKSECTYTQRMSVMIDTVKPITAVPTPSVVGSTVPIKINLGSGNDPLEGCVNVDMLARDDVDVVHNLMHFPYPFADSSAEEIKAIDLIEHLDHYTDDKKPTIIEFVKECHRILQPGGTLYIQTPHWDSDIFKIDPTHVRGFHPNSFDFFDPDTWYGQIRDFYDTPKFTVRNEMLENKNLRFWMVKK